VIKVEVVAPQIKYHKEKRSVLVPIAYGVVGLVAIAMVIAALFHYKKRSQTYERIVSDQL